MGRAALNNKKIAAYTAAQVVIGIAAAVGIGWLCVQLYGYWRARRQYQAMAETYLQPAQAAADADGAATTDPAATTDDADADAPVSVDFAALTADCPDAVGWLSLPDLGISYPLMQAADNDYYLRRAPDGTASVSGSVFLDCANTLQDGHLLIYGHTMQDGSMFGSLKTYLDADFCAACSGELLLYTPAETRVYHIFSAQRVDVTNSVYTIGFAQGAELDDFAQGLRAASAYDFGVDPTGTAQVVTLSTCARLAGGDERIVVSACLAP